MNYSKSSEPLELPRREVLKKLEEFRGAVDVIFPILFYQACEEAIEYLSVKNPTIEVENFDPNEKSFRAGYLIDILVLMQRWVKNHLEIYKLRQGELLTEGALLETNNEKVR